MAFARAGRGHVLIRLLENSLSVEEGLFSFETGENEWSLRVRMTLPCAATSCTWVPVADLTEWRDDIVFSVADSMSTTVLDAQLGPSNNTRGQVYSDLDQEFPWP